MSPKARLFSTSFQPTLRAAMIWRPLFLALWLVVISHTALGQTPRLGDIDGDQVPTVRDIALIVEHTKGTSTLPVIKAEQADINRDGVVNQSDIAELIKEILQTRTPELLPLASIQNTSPYLGEGNVAVTRETVLHFSIPLALNTTLDTTTLFAEFGGRKILSRAEISSDRNKATLFYLEPLPSSAQIKVTLKGAQLKDLIGRTFDADADGQAGGDWIGTFNTLSITPVPATAIRGRVFASERATGGADLPLAGVTITVDGAEETLRAVTDNLGNFTLSPCPAGSFFVQIDGRTSPQSSYPSGAYYPTVGKQWDAVAGRADNLAGSASDTSRGTIYLPLIRPNTLQTVSQIQSTPIELPASVLNDNPAMAGTRIEVPANSLSSDNGTRGGRVGLAPVAPDRIPSPLPPGLNLPLVITVQTDGGTNFDQPVPVTFPNVPDPVTGQKLPAGTKSALWSFNHDTGMWEIVGPMTVSDDGNFVTTDAGVGIIQPGWHGQQPGSTSSNAAPPPQDPGPPEGGPFGPCSSSPLENNRRRGACAQAGIAGVTAGVIARTIVCRVPGAKFWMKLLCGQTVKKIPVLDPFLAAENSKNCQQFYLDCNLNPGGRAAYKSAPSATVSSQTIDTIESIESDLALLLDLEAAAKEIIGEVSSVEELNADQLTLLNQLQDEFYVITGGKNEFDFFKQRLADLTRLEVEIRNSTRSDSAQTPSAPRYYAIENVDTSATLRGRLPQSGRLSSIPLAADQRYHFFVYTPGFTTYQAHDFSSAVNGSNLDLPTFGNYPFTGDTDSDDLPDEAEHIIGTDPDNSDSDGDGILDGVEAKQGTNPLDGLIVATGVIASAPTTAPATDIAAANNLAVTANGARGITVFNVLSGLNPSRIAEVDTPGQAVAVATSGDYVAVADYSSGLAIVDLTNPTAITIRHQIRLGSAVVTVATSGPLAFAGTEDRKVHLVDMPSGTKLGSVTLGGSGQIQDLAVSGDVLYALQVGQLSALQWQPTLAVTGTAQAPGGIGAGNRRLRLFAGTGTVQATWTSGFNIFNTATNPRQPAFVRQFSTNQFGWKQIVANGSGLGIAAASPNSTDDGAHDLDLYNLGPDGRSSEFLTTLITPGLAAAASIYNGLAYVADSSSGLQIVNYLAYDNKKIAPSITLSSNFNLAGGNAEEGSLMRLTASVADDVQVRNVEFYMDGQLVVIDGNYPFESRFVTPTMAGGKTSFKVRARATDTGGNATWSDEYTLTLVPDATPPAVSAFQPANNSIAQFATTVAARFSEPVASDTLAAGLTLRSAGPDKIHGNADDFAVTGGTFNYSAESAIATIAFPANLQPGHYELRAAAPLADVAGNAIVQAQFSRFIVPGPGDADGDGVPDDFEILLGLDPSKPDSNNNGILDGAEDFDRDGLTNAAEIAYGLNPMIADTDGNGINDGNEDPDFDGLINRLEWANGTDPLNWDSDGDGFDDAVEIAENMDPQSPSSAPPIRVISVNTSFLNAMPYGPDITSIPVVSTPASFLNAMPYGPDLQQIPVISLPTSYLNSIPETPVGDATLASPVTSFRNGP